MKKSRFTKEQVAFARCAQLLRDMQRFLSFMYLTCVQRHEYSGRGDPGMPGATTPRLGQRRHSGALLFCAVIAVASTTSVGAASGEPLAVVPFEMVNSHVVVPVSVNGSPPLSFVFDNASGGTVIHSSTAEALGLVDGGVLSAPESSVQIVDGQVVVNGAAAAAAESGLADSVKVIQIPADALRVASSDTLSEVHLVAGSSGVVMGGASSAAQVALGGFVLNDVEVSVLPLAHLTMPSGDPIDGIIGYDILKDFIVDVDYDSGVLRVFDRDAYTPSRGATRHEVTFLLGNMAQPCVAGDITLPNGNVVSGMFVLDAGAGADVVLNSPFVAGHDLVAGLGAADASVGSVSGVTPDQTAVVEGTLPGFAFCGISLDDVPATLNLGTTGFLAGEGYAGVIGNRILSRFNIAYDYVGGVVYLEPVSGS